MTVPYTSWIIALLLLAASVGLNIYQAFWKVARDDAGANTAAYIRDAFRNLPLAEQELLFYGDYRDNSDAPPDEALEDIFEPAGHSRARLPHRSIMRGCTWCPDLEQLDRRARLLSSPSSGSSSSSADVGSTDIGSSASGSAGSAHADEHHGHQHDALLFLFNAIFIGTAMLHFASICHGVQLTVVLFIFGVVVSLLLEGAHLKDHIGVFGQSYSMWMDIDPHLLLFTLLPVLLAGDAMTIDTHVAKRVVLQCLYLAGPGVMVQSLLVATFLKYYLNWTFLLSMVTSSILCATDPVAVVALLKELGASPMLTVQIQGESLLNDGTAIVLYTVCYHMLSGKTYDMNDMAMFLVKTAMMAMALGVFLGYLFFAWLRFAGNRFNHSSSVIQILLTLSAAYWSFCLAEGVLKMSGVLATVGSSIVLAHHMWPHIVSPSSLSNFWHTMEDLGNIIVFLLGGALTGNAMLHIEFVDYINLIVIYLVLTAVRGTLIFSSRPLLQALSRDKLPVSVADAAVMTWGGLRGAVGLALAIQVRRGRALDEDGVTEHITTAAANRVLFFVSGVAFLTTVVNATTCPSLVTWLGITALPTARQKLLHQFNQQLIMRSVSEQHPEEVTNCLRYLLEEIEHHIDDQSRMGESKMAEKLLMKEERNSQSIEEIISDYQMLEEEFLSFASDDRDYLEAFPEDGLPLGEVDDFIAIVRRGEPDEETCKAVVQLFLSLVMNNYWKLIEVGELQPGSPETDVLFTSIRVSLSPVQPDLVDIDFILQLTGLISTLKSDLPQAQRSQPEIYTSVDEDKARRSEAINAIRKTRLSQSKRVSIYEKVKPPKDREEHLFSEVDGKDEVVVDKKMRSSKLGKIVLSANFNISSSVAIITNTFYVLLEEVLRNSENDNSIVWLICESIFTLVFTSEFLLKLAVFRGKYWRDAWNVFDFMLVLLGISGVIMSAIAFHQHTGSAGSSGATESRVIRIARVLRTLRFLRVFRILNARLSADKYVSKELARHMHKMNCLIAFVSAHLRAEAQILTYLGVKDIIVDDDVAIARCLLQSQAAVYKALVCTLTVQQNVDDDLLEELKFTKERKRIVEGLEKFVVRAQTDGALSAREAESILHPMHDNISQCLQLLNSRSQGFMKPKSPKDLKEQNPQKPVSSKIVKQTANQSYEDDGPPPRPLPPPPVEPAKPAAATEDLTPAEEVLLTCATDIPQANEGIAEAANGVADAVASNGNAAKEKATSRLEDSDAEEEFDQRGSPDSPTVQKKTKRQKPTISTPKSDKESEDLPSDAVARHPSLNVKKSGERRIKKKARSNPGARSKDVEEPVTIGAQTKEAPDSAEDEPDTNQPES